MNGLFLTLALLGAAVLGTGVLFLMAAVIHELWTLAVASHAGRGADTTHARGVDPGG